MEAWKRRNSGRKMGFHKSLVILEVVWVVDGDRSRGHNFAWKTTIWVNSQNFLDKVWFHFSREFFPVMEQMWKLNQGQIMGIPSGLQRGPMTSTFLWAVKCLKMRALAKVWIHFTRGFSHDGADVEFEPGPIVGVTSGLQRSPNVRKRKMEKEETFSLGGHMGLVRNPNLAWSAVYQDALSSFPLSVGPTFIPWQLWIVFA